MNFSIIFRTIFLIIICTVLSAHSFIVIGHRGAAGREPENTLRSFSRAIEIGVPMIELDVHRCASGELVVMHDTTVDRTTDGVGPVACYTLHNLKKLDAGLGERVPTLAEVFDFVQCRVIINVELKGIGTAAPTAALIHKYVASHGWSYDDFLVSSFNINELTEFAQLAPQVPRGLLCSVFLPWKTCNDLKVSVVGIHVWLVTQDVIDEAHKRGITLFVFTVNSKNKARQLKEMHVDGIFSDYPDVVAPIA